MGNTVVIKYFLHQIGWPLTFLVKNEYAYMCYIYIWAIDCSAFKILSCSQKVRSIGTPIFYSRHIMFQEWFIFCHEIKYKFPIMIMNPDGQFMAVVKWIYHHQSYLDFLSDYCWIGVTPSDSGPEAGSPRTIQDQIFLCPGSFVLCFLPGSHHKTQD